jgi:ribonuclease HI
MVDDLEQSQHRQLPRDLLICWANVGKIGPAHNSILNVALEEGIDVLCVQEPWTETGTKTQTNPAFYLYAPVDSWDWEDLEQKELARPRVLTYVRKSPDLGIQQRRPIQSRDLLWLNVNGYSILNAYRQPGTDSVIDYVTKLVPPPKCLIGGDFNVHHDFFEPGVDTFSRGGELVEWSTDNMMDFIGEVGVPTQRCGHVLDLTFSNILWAQTTVRTDMHCGSDHETQVTVLPGRGDTPSPQHCYKVTDANLGRFVGLIEIGASALKDPWSITCKEEANAYAEALAGVFKAAIEGAGQVGTGGSKPARWWTQECRNAYKTYLASRQLSDILTPGKKDFLTTVRRAKREYWRCIIDNAKDDAALYKVIGWHKQASSLKAPPLTVNGRIVEDTMEKAEVLREEILDRFSADDDLAEFQLEDFRGATYLPWEQTVSLEEVERCTIGVSSTSPGTDRVTVRLIKACWDTIKDPLHGLFSRCLELSYFPDTWKNAEVVMIPKLGKKDKTSVRSWRPIALLSCISKRFERIISRRIAWTTLTHRVLSNQHGGALPKRSAMDLVASFTHDVEKAMAEGHQVTMVTLDVQGAFDALLANRLLQRMQRQGWPVSVLRLVRSFLTNRKVRVRLEDSTTAFFTVACGTPQGSPLSPVLYMLYLAELLNEDPRLRFGYADDICLYRASRTLEENVRLLAQDVRSIIQWGDENKIFFAPEKLEMIHLTTKRGASAPVLKVNDELEITPITTAPKAGQDPALRWLGVWFDRKLKFRRHVSERTAKARQVAQHIRNLARTKDGPPASSLRKAVTTCVLSSALYGTEAWYAGRTRPSQYKRNGATVEVSTRLGGLVRMVQSVITLAARGVLPVWRTTPLPTLMRDSGLPSAEVALEEAKARFALRLQTVDKRHPLAQRTKVSPAQRGRGAGQIKLRTKIHRLVSLLPAIPRPELRMPHFSQGCRTDPTLGTTKAIAAEQFKEWWGSLPPEDVTVFSDGSEQSKDGQRGVGYGFSIYQHGRKISDGLGTICSVSHVFDAEAVGAWKGLQAVLRDPTLRSRRIWMCIDSTSVIWCLRGNASDSSQWAFHLCQDAMQTRDIRIKWSPGHMGIEGNEVADALAGSAADPFSPKWIDDPIALQPTVCGIRSLARDIKKTATASWWATVEPKLSGRYRKWALPYEVKPLKELDLPRSILHRLLAIRTGHGDFDWYHTKFKHNDAVLDCSCGKKKTPDHLVYCRKTFRFLWNWPLKPKRPPRNQFEGWDYLSRLLASPKDFQKFLQITGFYSRICT